jgi:hypothetical protein
MNQTNRAGFAPRIQATPPAPMGGFGDTGPAPLMEEAFMPYWLVDLEVIGFVWVHTWRGHARDSMDAVEQARKAFYGGLYGDRDVMTRYALKVRAVTQGGL